MFFKKKAEAVVVSKNVEEREDAPIYAASGACSLLEAAAMQDKSKSMWDKTTLYNVSFSIGGKTKNFRVERGIYDTLKDGDKGTLVFNGSKFISFENA